MRDTTLCSLLSDVSINDSLSAPQTLKTNFSSGSKHMKNPWFALLLPTRCHVEFVWHSGATKRHQQCTPVCHSKAMK